MSYRIKEISEGGARQSRLPILYQSERSATKHKDILSRRHPENQYIVVEDE